MRSNSRLPVPGGAGEAEDAELAGLIANLEALLEPRRNIRLVACQKVGWQGPQPLCAGLAFRVHWCRSRTAPGLVERCDLVLLAA